MAIPKFIERYIDEIPGNGILTDSTGDGWKYQRVHNTETKFFMCRFTYMGEPQRGGYSTSVGNPTYDIRLTEYDTNPRFSITVGGSENQWKQITAPTPGSGEIIRTFRKWKKTGREELFVPPTATFYDPYLTIPWFLCKADVFTGKMAVIIGPWLIGWTRGQVTPNQFHWTTHARSSLNSTTPTASASFVNNIQSSASLPDVLPPPPQLWDNGPATDTEITHNGVQYKVLAGKPFKYGNKNIWAVQLRKVGSSDGEKGYYGPGSEYAAGHYEYEFNKADGELVTNPAGHQLRLKLSINRKEGFEVYYFDTDPVGGVNTVPIAAYGTNSQQFINNNTLQSVEQDAGGTATSYPCLNAQEVLTTDPFTETASSEGFAENLVQDDTTYGDTCVSGECTDCPDCPEDCYECRVFADGEEIADAGFSLAKSGDDCSCKLEVANLHAKRCKGRVAITGDLLDSSGFAQNFCSIIDDTDSTKIKVKCGRV